MMIDQTRKVTINEVYDDPLGNMNVVEFLVKTYLIFLGKYILSKKIHFK